MRSPGLVRPADGLPTAEDALLEHGLDWDRLERLARRALRDRMAHRRVSLPDERFEEAFEFCVDRGATRAREYDQALSAGIALETFLYRRMYHGLDDFLRGEGGDSRRGRPLRVELTFSGELPEGAGADSGDVDDAIRQVGSRLSPEAYWALEHLGRPMSEGTPIVVAAQSAGIRVGEAERRLECLRLELEEAA